MKTLSSLVLVFGCLTLMVSCGKSNSSNSNSDKSSNEFRSGVCGKQVVKAHNKIVKTCSDMESESDFAKCESALVAFINKYPQIDCQTFSEETGEEFWLTEEEYQEALDQIRDM